MTKLHYTELLSYTDGRLVAYNHMDGVYAVADAVVGPGVTTVGLTVCADKVKTHIRELFPVFNKPEIKDAITTALKNDPPEKKCDPLFKAAMDKYVLPLIGQEYFDVPHINETVEVLPLAEEVSEPAQ